MSDITFRVVTNKNDRFDEHAFDSNIGNKIVVNGLGLATIVDAKVVHDGHSALITIRTDKQVSTKEGTLHKKNKGE